MLAHGALLRSKFFTSEEVEAILNDYRTAGLSPAEVAIYAFAEKLTLNAYKVTPADVDGLRAHGLADREILDIALAGAARSFFSKTLDAMGAEPDEVYKDLDENLKEALAIGRPFA
jgi:alkylhydroperoxidase family enzyme